MYVLGSGCCCPIVFASCVPLSYIRYGICDGHLVKVILEEKIEENSRVTSRGNTREDPQPTSREPQHNASTARLKEVILRHGETE